MGRLPGAPSDAPAMRPWLPWLAAAYAALGGAGAGIAWALGRSPISQPSWTGTEGTEAVVASIVLGLATGALVVIVSRSLERRAKWARSLQDKLRPIVAHQSDVMLVALALAGGVCEELFFRGLLAPTVGVLLSSLAFGALHQVRGSGRVGWMVSAAALGAWMAVIYGLTGQLIGPIVAHVLINAMNLRHLRDHARSRAPKLGGLLRPSPTSLSNPHPQPLSLTGEGSKSSLQFLAPSPVRERAGED